MAVSQRNVALFSVISTSPAQAVPILQLYMEGGVYDQATETRIGEGADPLRIWAIGNVNGPGSAGDIFDVKLAIFYDSIYEPVNISLAEAQADGFGGFTDPTLANTATFLQHVTDGSLPLLGGGASLPNHG